MDTREHKRIEIEALQRDYKPKHFSSDIQFEEREGAKDENTIVGHAAVFDKDSEDFGGWIERIAPGAFDDVLEDDAIVAFNHDPNQVIGRNGKNTILTVDKTGLRYVVKLPDTTLARDLKQLIKDGIITQSSFAFTVRDQQWEHFKNKASIRTIVKVNRLYDVAPVTYPAYPDTTVAARALQNKPTEDLPVIDRSLYMKIQESIFNSQKK
jgi:HK97 family phage prohead protease